MKNIVLLIKVRRKKIAWIFHYPTLKDKKGMVDFKDILEETKKI